MAEPFIGSEAVARGDVSKSQLRSSYTRLFRDVYLLPGAEQTPLVRAKAGWLWSGRRAVVVGLTASAVLGSRWVDDCAPVELKHDNRHRLPGLLIRGDAMQDDEVGVIADLPLTTPARTALDLACWYPRNDAVVAIDALARATRLELADVGALAQRYPGRRNIVAAREAIDLADAGSESPQETRLRLLLVDGGLPKPETQIPIFDERGRQVARGDMGWEGWKIIVEYDGDHHRTDERQYHGDILRSERIQAAGWILVRVTAKDRPGAVLQRVRAAIARRA